MRRLGVVMMMLMVAALLAPAAKAAIKVGVVDLVEVTNNYERTKDASADLQVEQANLKQETEPKVKEIEDLRLKRDGFNRGTDEWKNLDAEILKKQIELRNWITLKRIQIERKHTEVLLDMYREITEAVDTLAKRKALDLVFTRAFLEPPQINVDESTGLEDLKKRIVGQRVLYPTNPEDLTLEVLNILNNAYKAKKTAPGAAG